MKTYAVIRIRGNIGKNNKAEYALRMIGLKKNHNIILLPESKLSMIKRAADYLTWGEVPDSFAKKLAGTNILSSPKKGFRSIKMLYPKGDIGYRGEKITELIERMSK